MAIAMERVIPTAAEMMTDAFYRIGQHTIGELDGSIADMVEVKTNFLGTVAGPVIGAVVKVVGLSAVAERMPGMFSDDFLLDTIDPVCEADEVFDQEVADRAAAETAFRIVSAVYEAFPELGGEGLERHMERAAAISRSHLRSEANFREAYPAPGR